jgi:uncharacterized protein (DUF1501 family)
MALVGTSVIPSFLTRTVMAQTTALSGKKKLVVLFQRGAADGGGNVRGGRVYGKWPGISPDQLNEGRDLAVTTDSRQVLGEAAYKTLGSRNLNTVFPRSQVEPSHFLNLLS